MSNSVIASYAILKVNWEQPERRDYLDNFVLLIAEAIRELPEDTVSLGDVQEQIRKVFGLLLPQNTIKSLLGRVSKYGYIDLHNGTYKRNNQALKTLKFRVIQQEVLKAHEALIGSLRVFAETNYKINWSAEETEAALLTYLQQNQVRLLGELIDKDITSLIEPNMADQKEIYILGKFVRYTQENQLPELDYLETVIKGNLLANAVFISEPSTYQRKFKNTVIILDSPLAIFALGYAGEPRQYPAIELVELLRKHGAELKIFRHSLEEIIGILSACADRVRRKAFRDSYGPSIEYFIQRGYSETDIMMFIENLEPNLARLGVTVCERPPYSEHEYVIDENSLLDYLKNCIHYGSDIALERDKDSLAAIFRLRHGDSFISIEESRAIFVTANSTLAICSRQFPEFSYQPGTAPLGITDYQLTNLVWLKDPAVAPNIPRRRLIADCFAATEPTEHLWSKYLTAIDKLEKDQKISDDQYYVLRHSIQAKSELMEKTLGDETAFTEGTVTEVLAIIEEKLRADQVKRANEEELARQEALQKLETEHAARLQIEEQTRAEKQLLQTKILKRADRISRQICFVLIIVYVLILAYLSYLVSAIGPLNLRNDLTTILKYLGLAIFWLLAVHQAASLIWDIKPRMILARLQPAIAKRIEKWLSFS